MQLEVDLCRNHQARSETLLSDWNVRSHIFASNPDSWYPRLGMDLENNPAYAREKATPQAIAEFSSCYLIRGVDIRFLCPLQPRDAE